MAINDKAKRVDTSLVSFLQYTDNERTCAKRPYLMAIKVAVELNKRYPFKNLIRLWDDGPQTITLKGISGYDLKGMVGETGILRKYYPHRSAAYVGFLQTYFGVIQSVFESEWNEPKKYIIATNRGITAFLKLLKSILKNEGKPIDQAAIRTYVQKLKTAGYEALGLPQNLTRLTVHRKVGSSSTEISSRRCKGRNLVFESDA